MKKLVLLFALYLSIGLSGAQNYIVNGSFEYGLNPNWSHHLETGGEAVFSLEQDGYVMDGEVGLNVQVTNAGAGQKSVISTVSMTAGTDSLYLLRFWARGTNRPGITDARELPSRIFVEVEGSDTPGVLYQMHTGRTVFHLPFKTTQKELKINFYFQDRGVVYALDGVEVVDQNNREGVDVLNTYIWQHNRTGQGWTAGDNDVSYLLPDGRTIWFFNDSFYGTNDVTKNPLYDTGTFIRNAVVIQETDGTLNSYSFTNVGGQHAYFQPPEPHWNVNHNEISNFLWVGDAILINDVIYVHLIEVDKINEKGDLGNTGKSYLGKFSYPGLIYSGMEQRPDFCTPYETYFADGDMLYSYKTESLNNGLTRHTHVARTGLDNLRGEEPWEYWNGNSWSANSNQSARVINNLGADGVIKLGEGNYAHVSMLAFDRDIQISFAPAPQGPWTTRQSVFTLPNDSNCWFYMPNFHSTLPNGNYSVSCSANYTYPLFFAWESFIDKYWYRPRYVQVDLLGLSPYSRRDCAGVSFGEAYLDECGECVGGTTGLQPCLAGVARLYSGCNFTGTGVGLNVGDYLLSDLEALGFTDNDLSSIELQEGYTVELFDNNQLGGETKVIDASSACLDTESFNDKTSSLVVRRTGISNLSGVYAIQNKRTGLYMSIENQSASNRALLEQAQYTENNAQKFELKDAGNGYYKISGIASNLTLSTVNLCRKPQTNIELWDGHEIVITNDEGRISSQYAGNTGEEVDKLIDNKNTTKYLTTNKQAWVQFQAATPQTVIKYGITSADASARDPKNWSLYGSNNGENWVTLDTRSGITFSRQEEKTFSITNETAYSYYRLDMECNKGNALQLAEWKLFTATSPGEEFDSQKFIVQDAGDGYVRFINKHSDMILEIFDDGLSIEGAKVWQITDVRQDGALWRLIDTSLSIQAAGEEETGSRIIVYPNPVKESLNMDLPAEWTNSRFVIHNVSGRAVQSGLVTPHAIPVARLAPGYYILKVYKENGVRIASFIKQ